MGDVKYYRSKVGEHRMIIQVLGMGRTKGDDWKRKPSSNRTKEKETMLTYMNVS